MSFARAGLRPRKYSSVQVIRSPEMEADYCILPHGIFKSPAGTVQLFGKLGCYSKLVCAAVLLAKS
jgi:hypothetical protein